MFEQYFFSRYHRDSTLRFVFASNTKIKSAFPGLVGKRFWDVWVGLECLSELSLAAHTNSA